LGNYLNEKQKFYRGVQSHKFKRVSKILRQWALIYCAGICQRETYTRVYTRNGDFSERRLFNGCGIFWIFSYIFTGRDYSPRYFPETISYFQWQTKKVGVD
jgi:hypothetical protein